jgi:hypothetical protein
VARADPAVVQPGTRLRLARAHAAASADTGLALDARVDVVSGIAPALDGRCAPVGRLHAVLAPEPLPELDPFADARIGVGTAGPAIEAARSWQAARTALRLTGPSAVTRSEQLGGLSLLADRLTAELAQVADLTALDRLVAGPGGSDPTKSCTRSAPAIRPARPLSRFTAATDAERALALLLRHLRDSPI